MNHHKPPGPASSNKQVPPVRTNQSTFNSYHKKSLKSLSFPSSFSSSSSSSFFSPFPPRLILASVYFLSPCALLASIIRPYLFVSAKKTFLFYAHASCKLFINILLYENVIFLYQIYRFFYSFFERVIFIFTKKLFAHSFFNQSHQRNQTHDQKQQKVYIGSPSSFSTR